MACHGRLHDTAVPAPWKLSYAPCQQGFFSPFLSLPSPLHSPSFFLFPCPLLHSPFCWEVRIQGGGGSPAGAAATAAVEPQLLRLSKWSWWVKKSHQMEGFVPPPLPRAQWQRQPSLLTQAQAPTLPSQRYSATPSMHPGNLSMLQLRHQQRPVPHALLQEEDCAPCWRCLFPTGQGSSTGAHRMLKHAREQAQHLAGKAIAVPAVPQPLSSLCKEWEGKELIKAWEINHISV